MGSSEGAAENRFFFALVKFYRRFEFSDKHHLPTLSLIKKRIPTGLWHCDSVRLGHLQLIFSS